MRKGEISIKKKVASEFQLGDLMTKPQPEALFVAQRESIMQWEAEFLDREQLLLVIPNHLRASDITVMDDEQNAKDEGQHDVRLQEKRESKAPTTRPYKVTKGKSTGPYKVPKGKRIRFKGLQKGE